jgi:hypothetical protein
MKFRLSTFPLFLLFIPISHRLNTIFSNAIMGDSNAREAMKAAA